MIEFTWAEVGNRIRDRRIALNMTQQMLADAAGITQPGLLRIERGETNPKMDTIRGIAKPLEMSVSQLMFGNTQVPDDNNHLIARVHRILDSGDRAAVAGLENSVEMIELLLRRGGHRVDDFGSIQSAGDDIEERRSGVQRAKRNENASLRKKRQLVKENASLRKKRQLLKER